MATQTTPNLMYKTTCKICGRPFESNPFVPLVGEKLDQRRLKMGQVLMNHIAMEHLSFMQAVLVAALFQFTDPVLLKEMEPYRWQVFQNTSKNYVDDATLENQLAGAGFDQAQIATVIELRDLLTETGEHAVIKPLKPTEPLVKL
jgi:hypothetical protein